MAKHTILFLAANLADPERLAIDREVCEALERSAYCERFKLETLR
jgi:hypothetical protein